MPRFTKHRKTKQYSNEFKTKAVQLSLIDGIQVQEVAATLDIHPFMLSRWRKEYREGAIMPDKRKKVVSLKKESNELTKLKQLQKENARLKQENDLLKKWQRFLAEERGIDLDSSSDTDKTSE
jgi:transposase